MKISHKLAVPYPELPNLSNLKRGVVGTLLLCLSCCVMNAQTIVTVAGNGSLGYTGDGIAATAATVQNPFGVALDDAGNLYIADTDNRRIRKVNAAGIISTVAGNGSL